MARLSITFAASLLALTVTGCGSPAPAEQPPLAGARLGGPFTLTSETGQPVRWSDFDGRYRIVYFGYTFCPDVCPNDMARIAQGLKALDKAAPDKAARIVPLFITVDPARDTAAVVREFTDAFDPRIIGVTGSEADIAAAAKAFGVYAARGEAKTPGAYMVDHTNIAYLFGPRGEPIATLPTDQGGGAVAAELEKWIS